MQPVEIIPVQEAIVLRARGSELLILADHVVALKKLKSAGDFSKYFLEQALVNRPARKLFEAWLRKDGSLWARVYKSVQTIDTTKADAGPAPAKPAPVKSTPVEKAANPKTEASVEAKAKTPEKKSEAPAAKAKSVKEAPAKDAKKSVTTEKAPAKKEAAAAKTSAKSEKTTKSSAAAKPKAKATPAAKKPAAKKTSKK